MKRAEKETGGAEAIQGRKGWSLPVAFITASLVEVRVKEAVFGVAKIRRKRHETYVYVYKGRKKDREIERCHQATVERRNQA